MILPDLNVLLYAYNPHVARHEVARAWWESVLNGKELVGLPHEVLFGFIRIATNPRLGRAAVSLDAARNVVESWLDLPHSRILTPGPDHFACVMKLMEASGSKGSVLSDAVLAGYAIANRATLCSSDTDFARFPELDWRNPMG